MSVIPRRYHVAVEAVHRTRGLPAVLRVYIRVSPVLPYTPRCAFLLLPLRTQPSFFDYTMSQAPSTSTSTSNFDTIFAAALKDYKKQTKKDIASHPLAAALESCHSSDGILTVLQTQIQTFDQSQSADGRWTRFLDPTVNVLYAFSGFLSNVTGPVNCEALSHLRATL